MFDHFAVSVLVVPALVLVGTWVTADRIRPDVGARVFAWSAVAVSASSAVSLFVFGLKAAAEQPSVARLGDWSDETVRADTAHVPWVSAVALLWLLAGAVAVVVGTRRYRGSLRAAWETVDGLGDDGAVTLLADDRVEAFAVPGRAGQEGRVVVTDGMRRAVDGRQLHAVVAHERAHLEGGHHRLIWLVRAAALAHPLLWPMVVKVEYLVERAADEAAARAVGDRDDVARALGHAAIAVLDSGGRAAVGAHGRHQSLLSMGYPPSAVPRRVAALTTPAIRRRWLLAIPLACAVATVVWTFEGVYDLPELLAHAAGTRG